MKKIAIIICISLTFGLAGQDYKEVLESDNQMVRDTSSRIALLTEYRDGRMWLRWAPNRPSDWAIGVANGYKVEKFELDDNLLPILSSKDSTLVKPWTPDQFEPYNDRSNDDMLVMGEAMYGVDLQSLASQGPFASAQKELSNRHGFALLAAEFDFGVSEAGGIGYADSSVTEGKNYFYRVTIIGHDKPFPGLNSLEATEIPVQPPYLKNAIEDEGKVTLQWERNYHEQHFSGYWVERSTDDINYERLTKRPYVGTFTEDFTNSVFTFVDSVANYQPHYYRLIGITPFSRLSAPSFSVRLIGRDKTGCGEVSNLSVATDADSKLVLLDWDDTSCDDLQGYLVERASEVDGPFEMMTPTPIKKSEYQTTVDNINEKHYYQVSTIDTAGNALATLPLLAAFRDTIAPESPTGLSGQMDTMGITTLNWNDNLEEDLHGYFIYKSNSSSHVFTLINASPLRSSSFVDTNSMQTLTEEIFYKVTAVDFNGHVSEFSAEARIARPDLIAPFPPSIITYTQEEDHIQINWSTSKSKDVVRHVLYRKQNNETWKVQDSFDDSQMTFKDYAVVHGLKYSYKIIAIDDANLKSVDKAKIALTFIDKSTPNKVQILSCDQLDGVNQISWDTSNIDDESSIIIYRAVDQGPLTVLDRVKNISTYRDDNLRKNHNYRYAIKVKWANGRKSPFSDIVNAPTSK